MPVSFRLLPTLTFLLLLTGVPVWALTASDTTRPAQAQDPLPDMGIAPISANLRVEPSEECDASVPR